MQRGGDDVEDALRASCGCAAGLLHQQAHGVGFVQQAQLAGFVRLALIPRIQEHAATHEDAVHIGHHAAHPAHVEVASARTVLALQAFVDVALDWWRPVTQIRHIDRELASAGRNLQIALSEDETALFPVQGEHGHSMPYGEHELGLRAIDAIAGGNLLAAGLEKMLLGDVGGVFGNLQHGKDGADGDVHVDIGRAIERVEQQQVFAARVVLGDREHGVHFFRGHGGQMSAPLVGVDQHIVGDDVELLLHFALHVAGAGGAEHVAQCAFVHGDADAFAGAGDHFDEQAQLGRDDAVLALLLDEIAGEVDGLGHGESLEGKGRAAISRPGRVR